MIFTYITALHNPSDYNLFETSSPFTLVVNHGTIVVGNVFLS